MTQDQQQSLRYKDLSQEDPCPMEATTAGYPWLPRMTDKARASVAGTLGDYYRYPCPIDGECLSRLQITSGQFAEIAQSASTYGDVVTRLREAGASLRALSDFDPVALNTELHSGS